jgi:hypothetical protein
VPDTRPQHSHVSRCIDSDHGPTQLMGNQLPHDRPLSTRLRWHGEAPGIDHRAPGAFCIP